MAGTVVDQMVRTLLDAGVKRIYGIVGDSLNGFTDAIRRHGEVRWLHVRHEEVAAFAAGQITGVFDYVQPRPHSDTLMKVLDGINHSGFGKVWFA